MPLIGALQEYLRGRVRQTLDPGSRMRAAVLVCLTGNRPDQLSTLLLKRSETVGRHAGEMAFPGGMIEAGDAGPEDAALREAEEEVGLARDRVRVLGRLEELVTATSGVHVTPVVGHAEGFGKLRPDPVEVAGIVEVPLRLLRDPERKSWETFVLPEGLFRVPVYRVPERVWGATARILQTLLEALDATPGQR